MRIHSATVSSKGQITLPKEFREGYHLKAGEEIMMLPTDEGILLKHKKIPLRGMFAGKIDVKGFERDIKAQRREWVI